MVEELRNEIKKIDAEILSLIARRLYIAKEIGKDKESRGLPVRDYSVEKKVIERMKTGASEYGIPQDTAEEITLSLIKASVRAQVLERKVPVSNGERICAVIGGRGKMGRWFCEYFASMNWKIRIIDKGEDIRNNLANADVIIVAVSLGSMKETLSEVVSYSPSGIIIEIASLKSDLEEIIMSAKSSGISIASIHPMFGPDTDILSGKNMIICNSSSVVASDCKAAEEFVKSLFSRTALNLIELPLEKHDLYMTYVLTFPHLLNIMAGDILSSSGFSLEILKELGGTTFHRQLSVTTEVLSENPDLYYEIQKMNPHRIILYDGIKDSVEKLKSITGGSEYNEFINIMNKGKLYFNRFNLFNSDKDNDKRSESNEKVI